MDTTTTNHDATIKEESTVPYAMRDFIFSSARGTESMTWISSHGEPCVPPLTGWDGGQDHD
jgi:hypothetical protein